MSNVKGVYNVGFLLLLLLYEHCVYEYHLLCTYKNKKKSGSLPRHVSVPNSAKSLHCLVDTWGQSLSCTPLAFSLQMQVRCVKPCHILSASSLLLNQMPGFHPTPSTAWPGSQLPPPLPSLVFSISTLSQAGLVSAPCVFLGPLAPRLLLFCLENSSCPGPFQPSGHLSSS